MTCPGAGSGPKRASVPEGIGSGSPLENHAPEPPAAIPAEPVWSGAIVPVDQPSGTSIVQPSGSVYVVQPVDVVGVGATDEATASDHSKMIGTAAKDVSNRPAPPAPCSGSIATPPVTIVRSDVATNT